MLDSVAYFDAVNKLSGNVFEEGSAASNPILAGAVAYIVALL